MEGLIFLMNNLHDALRLTGSESSITLPRIAVVGGQSAGKSSVLENFVGKSFLPCGGGIVTRRPLVLQLIFQEGEEYAEFQHKPGCKYPGIIGVTQEIEKTTNDVCGETGVSDSPINLKIYSPFVINLTLVDLPGIVKIATKAQDSKVVETISRMVSNYIQDENCLILAVTPANLDIANSDAIAMAQKIDPNGDRTIGVITKLDTNLNSYEHVVETLNNEMVHLKRGYIGVINRQPHEMKERIDRETVRQRENEKLQNLYHYRNVTDRIGVVRLQDYLQKQLVEHIEKSLPKLKHTISEKLRGVEKQLEGCDLSFDEVENKAVALTKVVTVFTQAVEADLGFQKEIVKEFKQLTIGAKIKELLFVDYPKLLSDNLRKYKSNLQRIVMTIQGTNGIFATDNFPTPAFHKCVRDVLFTNRIIVEEVSMKVRNMLQDLIESEAKDLISFENLREEVIINVSSGIETLHKNLLKTLNAILDSQENYIDDRNADYVISNTPPMSTQQIIVIDQKPESEYFIAGDVVLIRKSKMMSSTKKEMYAELQKDKLAIFNSKKSRELKYTFALSNMTYKIVTERNGIILNIPNSPPSELMLASEDMLGAWCDAFNTAGVQDQDKLNAILASGNKTGDKNSDSGDMEENEPEIEDKRPPGVTVPLWNSARNIKNSVVAYVTVTNKVLHDITSKVICNELPIKMREEIGPVLSAKLAQVLEEKNLMKINDRDMEKIVKLQNTRKTLKSVMSILNNPSSAITKGSSAMKSNITKSNSLNNGRGGGGSSYSNQSHSAQNMQSSGNDRKSFNVPSNNTGHSASSVQGSFGSDSSLYSFNSPAGAGPSNKFHPSSSNDIYNQRDSISSVTNKIPTNLPNPRSGGFNRPLPNSNTKMPPPPRINASNIGKAAGNFGPPANQ